MKAFCVSSSSLREFARYEDTLNSSGDDEAVVFVDAGAEPGDSPFSTEVRSAPPSSLPTWSSFEWAVAVLYVAVVRRRRVAPVPAEPSEETRHND